MLETVHHVKLEFYVPKKKNKKKKGRVADCLTIKDGFFALPVIRVAGDLEQPIDLECAARAAVEAEDGVDVVC